MTVFRTNIMIIILLVQIMHIHAYAFMRDFSQLNSGKTNIEVSIYNHITTNKPQLLY